MLTFLTELFKGFWGWISIFPWWQGLIILSVVLIILLIGKYWRKIPNKIAEIFTGVKAETLQYRMYWGLVNNALNILLKNEIRRSFKENGFENLSGSEFSNYVKDKSKTLQSMLKQHIMDLYPPESKQIFVKMSKVLEYIDSKDGEYEDLFFEVFIEAKKFKKQEIESYLNIDTKFSEEVEKFIKNNKDVDCKNCILILFGKREIAENKKRNIKTLKSQMNFAEQKLIEIQSDLMDFYSKNLKSNK